MHLCDVHAAGRRVTFSVVFIALTSEFVAFVIFAGLAFGSLGATVMTAAQASVLVIMTVWEYARGS